VSSDFASRRFIDEEISVHFDRPPVRKKVPGPPDAFDWRGQTYRTVEVLSRWSEYERKGRAAKNMAPAHARVAQRRGSWGVGRLYFRMRTATGQVFDVYYDRAPEGAGDRSGHWFLYREMEAAN
jgi:Family of unknown function (DUF6504)